jgi:WD40 repeat protein
VDGALVIWEVGEYLLNRVSEESEEGVTFEENDDEDDDDVENSSDDEKEVVAVGDNGDSVKRKRQKQHGLLGSRVRRPPQAAPKALTVTPRAILDTNTGAQINDVSCHATQSHLVVAATEAGDAVLYDLRMPNGKPSGVGVMRHEGGVNAVQFHPSAQFQVATGGEDAAVRLWDLRAWKNNAVATYRYHTAPVQCVAWAPFSDRVFASAGDDGLVCLWNLGRGVEAYNSTAAGGSDADLALLPRELAFVHAGHVAPVLDVQWNPSVGDEWTVASVDHSNLLQIWRPTPTAVSDAVTCGDLFDEDMLDDNAQ